MQNKANFNGRIQKTGGIKQKEKIKNKANDKIDKIM